MLGPRARGGRCSKAQPSCPATRCRAGIGDVRATPTPCSRPHPLPGRRRVRLWIDRFFAAAGRARRHRHPDRQLADRGDAVNLSPRGSGPRVRGVETHRRPRTRPARSRFAVSIAGVGPPGDPPGRRLVTPGAWELTDVVDVRLLASARRSAPARRSTSTSARAGTGPGCGCCLPPRRPRRDRRERRGGAPSCADPLALPCRSRPATRWCADAGPGHDRRCEVLDVAPAVGRTSRPRSCEAAGERLFASHDG